MDEHRHMSSACTRRNEPISFYHIDQIICSRIRFSDGNIDIVDPIFTEDSFDLVLVDIRQRHCIRDRNAPLFLSANDDSRRAFI